MGSWWVDAPATSPGHWHSSVICNSSIEGGLASDRVRLRARLRAERRRQAARGARRAVRRAPRVQLPDPRVAAAGRGLHRQRALHAGHHDRGHVRPMGRRLPRRRRSKSRRRSTRSVACSRTASPTSPTLLNVLNNERGTQSCTCQCTTGCDPSRSRSPSPGSPASGTAASRSRASPTSTTPQDVRKLLADYGLTCWGAVTLTLADRNLCAKDEQQRAASVALHEERRHDGQGARRPGDHDRAEHGRQDRSGRHARRGVGLVRRRA